MHCAALQALSLFFFGHVGAGVGGVGAGVGACLVSDSFLLTLFSGASAVFRCLFAASLQGTVGAGVVRVSQSAGMHWYRSFSCARSPLVKAARFPVEPALSRAFARLQEIASHFPSPTTQ